MKLMVLDGNSIINRAYYGVRPLTTRDGFFTHAIFGFLTMLGRLLDEEKPEALCVAFDRREPTFRHLEYEGYKATRHAMPEELAMQMPVLKDVLDAMNIPRYELAGFEADDLIGTISRKCESAGWDCVVATGDKDSLQLVTEHTTVKLISTRMGQTTTKDMTPESFREVYGFAPIHIVDLKALMGDASDNIPGVPGVGEKTAMALIQKYQSIDEIYRLLPDIEAKPNVIKKLTEGEESARQSFHLATIVTDAPLEFSPQDNLRKAPSDALYPLFMKLEFTKLIEKYGLKPPADIPTAEEPVDLTVTAEAVTTVEKAKEYLSLFRKAEHVTLLALPDLSGVIVDFIAGESTAVSAEFYFSRYEGDWNALLRALFSDDIKKVSHNVKDLQRTLLENDLPIEGFIFDTALAGYLLDATAGKYDIASLFAAYFHQTLAEPKHLDPDAFSMLGDTAEAETAFHVYTSAVDALYEAFAPELEKRELHELYYEVELPLCAVLARMEHAGMRVDANALAAFGSEMEVQLKTLEQHIYEESGGPFNINSPKQLGEVLFERLQLPHGKKTKTGWSTNADVLEKLRWENPIVEEVLQYRQYAKFRSTYCDGLLKVIAPDGRIHTSFQMTVTATGRLSSTEPNLQNIPTRTQLGSEFRRMFVPADGCVAAAAVGQCELMYFYDKLFTEYNHIVAQLLLTGEDIHTVTAAQVFGVPTDQVTKQMRSHAKAVNFGIVYGISAFSLAQDIGVPVYEAKEYIETYFERFPGIRRYMDEVVAQAKERGYVETLMHRRRALPELAASNFNTRSFGERVARNMPIQGTAADVIKLAMVRVDERLHKENLKAKLILQVHDELIVECPEEEKETVARLLTEEMEGAVHLSVPLTAEAHWGKNWLEAK